MVVRFNMGLQVQLKQWKSGLVTEYPENKVQGRASEEKMYSRSNKKKKKTKKKRKKKKKQK